MFTNESRSCDRHGVCEANSNAPRRARFTSRLAAVLFGVSAASALGASTPEDAELEEVIVRADASVALRQGDVGSATTIDADAVRLTRANHPNELLVRVPGVWITRGSGHEHLTAIRSGVYAGAGACGEFLFLENGIPIRPAGFCNVNNLFELNTEQAATVEAVRGPASALFGGNALHGAINTVTASGADGWGGSLEAGPYNYLQARFGDGSENWRVNAVSTATSGYRDDTGYGQQKATFGARAALAGWAAITTWTVTLLNQETGGYVLGFNAYDSAAKRSNPNPEAYRDAWSARAASVWRRDLGSSGALAITPYFRRSSMAFLQHFLPGQPLEKNAQTSGGARVEYERSGQWRWSAGTSLEVFEAALSQRQDAATQGSAFLVATRPAGTHYDYRVRGATLAAFFNAEIPLAAALQLVASGRAERNAYDYDNRHLDGNTRDDGTRCGFGGCLYTRPADRRDAFANFAGRLGLAWSPNDNATVYVLAGQGFRPPQTTELYRLQRGQTVADLHSEKLFSAQIGARGKTGGFSYDLAIYAQTTKNLIFRDARGFNVSDGETESTGLEWQVAWRSGGHALELTGAYANHRYAFTRDAGRGERIADGNVVDTAPRLLGSAHWRWQGERLTSEFEVAHVGAHYLDAANTARYGGHTLWNWRGAWQASPAVALFAKLLNLRDAPYAERADFAFGNYRYFPGMPRRAYLGVEVRAR